jgi:anti-anti-sigma regulatory factor
MESTAQETRHGQSAGFVSAEAGSRSTAGASSDHVLFDDGMLRITRAGGQPWLVIAGEIDEAGYDGLLLALGDVSHAPGDIHIDLAGVHYFDLAGLRAFVLLGEASDGRHDYRGRRVVLHEIPAHMKTTLEILGWDCIPDLVIASTRSP